MAQGPDSNRFSTPEDYLFISPMLVPIVAIIAFAVIRIVRINAARDTGSPVGLTNRVEELERELQVVQQQLAETQERMDFAERLLAKGKEGP
ncbi:MAG TPA: hypothetical protein VH439_07195 [Gemmatimonadales bacterium]